MSDASPTNPLSAHVLRLSANIGVHKGLIDEAELQAAMAPWEPVDAGLTVDLTPLPMSDGEPMYWKACADAIRPQVAGFMQQRVAPSSIRRLCVFGFAPIPLLAVFGECIGEKLPARVFNRFRSPSSWTWKASRPTGTAWIPPRLGGSPRAQQIAVLVSASGKIDPDEVDLIVSPRGRALYEIAIEDPRLDAIQTEAQVAEFSQIYRDLLATIRNTHGLRCTIHLFAAAPVAIAIELGRCVLPKTDPAIRLYDHQRDSGYRFALDLLPTRPAPRDREQASQSRLEVTGARPDGTPEKLRVLLLAANPVNYQPIDAAMERNAIYDELRISGPTASVVQIDNLGAVTLDDFLHAVGNYNPHVLHFTGHGNERGEPVLVTADGEGSHAVSSQVLETLLSSAPALRCVVLNACYSANVATALVKRLQIVVVGMPDRIADRHALEFARQFYQSIARGRDLQSAYDAGRRALKVHSAGESDLPDLNRHFEVHPDQIVLLPHERMTRLGER